MYVCFDGAYSRVHHRQYQFRVSFAVGVTSPTKAQNDESLPLAHTLTNMTFRLFGPSSAHWLIGDLAGGCCGGLKRQSRFDCGLA